MAKFKVVDVFKSNTKLKAIEVEEGGKSFAAKDGVLYEVSEDGVADTLLFCPVAKSGTLIVPKEVRKVENGAFADHALTAITFENYEEGDANYGKPLLVIGGITYNGTSKPTKQYAVFSSTKAITIKLPSHLKNLGVASFHTLSNTNAVIEFHPDALQKITWKSGKAMPFRRAA